MDSESKLQELLDDPSFHQWVHKQDEEAVSAWEAWMKGDAARQALAWEAAQIIRDLSLGQEDLPEAKVQRNWERLQASIRAQQEAASPPPATKRWVGWRWVGAAAAGLSLLVGLYVFLVPKQAPLLAQVAQTGEIRQVRLPDSSTVILNANSMLRYHAPREGEEWNREVWLEGEGFFTVTTTPDKDRFVVHAADLAVEVWGTRFNVRNRQGVRDVVLEEGEVHTKTPNSKPLILSPGERATIDEAASLQKEAVDVQRYTQWQNDLLAWENLTLGEAIERINAAYHWHLTVSDSHLLQEDIQGRIPLGDSTLVLTILTELLDAEVKAAGNTFHLHIR